MPIPGTSMNSPGGGSSGSGQSSWERSTDGADGAAPSLDPLTPTDSEKVLFKPKPRRPHPDTDPNPVPMGVHRDFLDKHSEGGDPAEVATGARGDKSPGTRDYYYAPGAPGLTPTGMLTFGDFTAGALIFAEDQLSFPEIEEDEEPRYLLFSEYPRAR